MNSHTCKIQESNGVRIITLARPEARNAFNKEMRLAVNAAFVESAGDDSIKAVLLTGEGTSFSAGIDLKELAELRESIQEPDSGEKQKPASGEKTDADNQDVSDKMLQNFGGDSWSLLSTLQDFPKPVLMAVNGAGVGLGTTILGFADIAIAGESAKFKCPFTEMGVGAEASSTWLLPQLVGWQNAAWMLLSSEWIDASQALEMGLVYAVEPDKSLLEKTLDLATKIASRDLASITAIKQTMNSWRQKPISLAASQEGKRFTELLTRS